jgi:hypothetical protein
MIGACGSMPDPQFLRYVMQINGLISIIIIFQPVANLIFQAECIRQLFVSALNERGAMPLSKYSMIPTQWATGRLQN